jgi:HlyD family secretion protein
MKRRIRSIVLVLVIALGAVGAILLYRSRKADDGAPPLRTATVERRDIIVAVTAVGTLEPLTTVDVKANVAGEIVRLAVDRGDYVRQGDLIASIDPTETQSAYDQSRADVSAALARVQQNSAELAKQRELTPAQIRSAEDAVNTAQSRVAQAKAALEYQRQSTTAGIAQSVEALDAARARLRQAEERATAQPQLTAAAIQQRQAEERAAQQALSRLTDATQPQERAVAESALEAARTNLATAQKALERSRSLFDKGFLAKQAVEDAEQVVSEAQDRYDTARAAVDTLQRKQATDREQAEAQIDQARAALETARVGTVDDRVAEQELVAARAALRETEASKAAAEAALEQDRVRERELATAESALQEARTQVRVAKANARQRDVSASAVAEAQAQADRSQAQLANAVKNLAYTTVVAPRDGLVIDRFIEQGTVVPSGRSTISATTNLVTLADVSRMFVLAEVDEADIGQVKLGQEVEIEVETFRERKFAGRVTQLYPRGEEIENVTIFRVRIEVDGPAEGLRPGMTAETSIIIRRAPKVLAVPNEALYEQEGKSFVDVPEGKTGTATRSVEVQKGAESFEWTEVRSGLSEGDEVVLNTSAGMGGFGGGPPGGKGGGKGDSREQMRRMMKMAPGGKM